MSRRERVVVVTGASAGVGRAIARRFADSGDRIALLARGEAGLRGAAEDIRLVGGRPLPIAVDMADHTDVQRAADRVERELGPIDVWVNNAFAGTFAPFTELDPEEFARITEVTYLGYVYGTKSALRHMLPRDRGVIVQVSSALAHRGIPLQSAYCAAKHAINGFTESLRCELLHDKARVAVTMVALPAVNTPQFDWARSRLPRQPQPVPPIYQPEVAADAVWHAARRPRRREYWVGGSTVGTLLANRIAPGLLDRYLARVGYRAQQTGEPGPTDGGNLWHPVDGAEGSDHGAHGRFDDRAKASSPQPWLSRHRGVLAGAALSGLSGLGMAAVRRRAHRRLFAGSGG